MNDHTVPESKAGNASILELGFALGQNHTFGLVAARCSAAQAYGIRRLREQKIYKQCCEKWNDFCPTYLSMSRAEADRIIQNLDEFGPAYFELSQLTRVSPETFRAIAPALSDGALHHKGEAIPLNAENSRKVAAAVTEMRSELKRPAEPDMDRRVHNMANRCLEIVGELERISRDQQIRVSRISLRQELTRLRDEIVRVAA